MQAEIRRNGAIMLPAGSLPDELYVALQAFKQANDLSWADLLSILAFMVGHRKFFGWVDEAWFHVLREKNTARLGELSLRQRYAGPILSPLTPRRLREVLPEDLEVVMTDAE